VDERAIGELSEEGAALVVLTAEDRGPRIAGVATAANSHDAAERALAEAGVRAVDATFRPAAGAPSYRSALACIDAMRAAREGARAVLACAEGAQGAVALVIIGGET
ncbi:MAG TPA: hypothetical protein VIL20_26485, partial [Sandaracinaceae bacterium]